MNEVKMAVITSFLSKTKDRFHEYNEERNLEERFALVSEMDGVDGVEIVYPYEADDAERVATLCNRYRLNIAAVNVNVKAEPEFLNGGLTSSRKETREKAVRFIKQSKEFAAAAGANKVTCCPLGDGYEFAFQTDYAQAWKHLVDGFGEAASHMPEVPLFVEYKPSETRGSCYVDTAAKAVCLIREIGIPEIGITLDFGHSLYGNENPPEALSLISASGIPYYVHINDNDGRWDWDFFVGTKHFLEYVEFLYYLQEYGYSDYLTSDTSPTRWDIKGTFEANNRLTRKIWHRLQGIDRRKFGALIHGDDYLETWKFIETEVFGLR